MTDGRTEPCRLRLARKAKPLTRPRTRARTIALSSLFAVAVLHVHVQDGAAQQPRTGTVSGHVSDRLTQDRIPEVLVSVRGTDRSAVTNTDGLFRITGIPAGPQRLTFTHIAYGEHGENVTIAAAGELSIEVRISRQAIEISPLRVEAQTELEQRRISTGNRMNEILREEIDDASLRGISLPELLRQGMSGVRVWGARGTYCVEYRGTPGGGQRNRCREVAVYIDEVKVGSPSILFATMPLRDIERIELLSPGEAGARYGVDAGFGVLRIETRQGVESRGRTKAEAPARTFDWALEPNPYPWARVLGSSIVGNALGVGLGLLLADQCIRLDDGFNGLRAKCIAPLTVVSTFGSLVVPSLAGSVAARWAGSTTLSKGRIIPSALLGATSVAIGYMLVVRGETHGSGGASAAGGAVLIVGTPLIMTIADRAFRAAR